ncbi:MAG: hypothetical protein JXJ20_06570 [Anaerolineae bacterium]|jgi:hypothetical protein|nr:hypothetical protein [Anaerolineae bacterium]
MARQREDKARRNQQATRHPLLIYYNMGKRYRAPGMLLMVMGLLLFLPSFISELESNIAEPAALARLGAVVLLVGLAFWLFSTLAIRRSYVQCNPDLFVIRTPFYRVLVSYRRIRQYQPVQVGQVFSRKELKGMGKPLIRPLLGMTAVEMQMKSWPAPKQRLRRFLGNYMLAPQGEAWLFIVPDYSVLIRQLDAAIQQKLHEEKGGAVGYEDPIERLKYYQG